MWCGIHYLLKLFLKCFSALVGKVWSKLIQRQYLVWLLHGERHASIIANLNFLYSIVNVLHPRGFLVMLLQYHFSWVVLAVDFQRHFLKLSYLNFRLCLYYNGHNCPTGLAWDLYRMLHIAGDDHGVSIKVLPVIAIFLYCHVILVVYLWNKQIRGFYFTMLQNVIFKMCLWPLFEFFGKLLSSMWFLVWYQAAAVALGSI